MRTFRPFALLAASALALVVGCKEPSVPSEGGSGPCDPADCGPQPGMPNQLCPDGKTMAGPGPCARNADGTCGYPIVSCPPADTTGGGPEAFGAVCGSRGSAPCPEGQFCDFPKGSECGATDRGGACKPKPEMCTQAYEPVCGCDGETYPSACAAAQKGVSVSQPGPC